MKRPTKEMARIYCKRWYTKNRERKNEYDRRYYHASRIIIRLAQALQECR